MSNDGLSFAVGIDTSGFRRGEQELERSVQRLGDKITGELGECVDISTSLEGALKKLGTAVGIAFSATQAWELAKAVRSVRSEIQSYEISFTTLLNSKAKADALFGSIREFATNTPMQLRDLASAAQMMLSFNIGEDKIMPYLKALGDISMGDTQRFNSLALAFSQMSSAGKLMGQDLMQMVNAGFNPLAQMADKSGKSIKQLKDEMSAGKITAEMVQQAFMDAASEGGKYFGMLEKQSKGIQGAMSNLQGAIDDMLNDVGMATEGIMVSVYETGTEIVKNWRDVAEAIAAAVAAYGLYKTAVMASAAVDSTIKGAQYTAESEQLAKVIALKGEQANADVAAAVASGKLSKAKGDEIIAMRAEAQAVVELLKVKARDAEMDVERAIIAEAQAKRRYLAAVDNLKVAQSQLVAAQKSGDVFAISAAQANVDAAAQERDAAMRTMNGAAADVKAKKETSAAAATMASTAATEADAAAQVADAAATSFLAAAKAKLMTVTQKLHAAIMAHPYALAAAAVAALAYAVYKLCTIETEAEKAAKRLDDAHKEFSATTEAEKIKIDTLFARLKAAKKGTKEYADAKQAIQSQYGSYLANLSAEARSLNDVAAAYEAVKTSALAAARARQMQTFMDSEAERLGNTQASVRDRLHALLVDKFKDQTDDTGMSLVEKYFWQVLSSREFDPNNEASLDAPWLRQFDRAQAMSMQGMSQVVVNNDITDLLNELSRARAIFDNQMQAAERKFGSNPLSQPKQEEQQAKTYAEAYAEAEREWRNALAKLNQMQSSKDRYTQEEYEQAKANKDAAEQRFKSLGGKTDNKGKSAAELSYVADAASESLTSVERKQERERKRMAEDMEIEMWQARIDGGEYGFDAYMQQMQLNHKQEQIELQRQMEDAIDAEIARQKELWDKREELNEKEAKAKGSTYTRKAFNSDALSGIDFSSGATFSDPTIGDVDMANIYAIAQQYATLQSLLLAKQKAAQDEETRRQQQTMSEYLRQWGDYAEKRQAIIDIANDRLNDPNANLTAGQRASIVAQMQKDLSDLDMEANKTTNAIAKMFGDMSRKSAAEIRLIADNGQKVLDMLASGKYDKELGKSLNISEETFNTLSKSPEELDKIREAIRKLRGEADNVESPLNKIADGLEKIFEKGDNQSDLIDGLRQLNEGLADVLGMVNVVTDSLSQLGDAFGSSVLSGVADTLSAVTNVANSTMKGAQAGVVFGAWGAAAGAAVGLVGSLGSSLAKLHDAKHEKAIKRLQDQAETLQKGYDTLARKIEQAYSSDAKGLIEDQNRLLEQQKRIIEQQIKEEESKKKTDNDRIKQWRNQIDEINRTIEDNKAKALDAIFGEDIKSAINRFADAYASMFDSGISRAKSARDFVRSTIKQMVQESINAASSEPMRRFRDMMAGFWTDGIISSFEEATANQYIESLMADLESQFSWAQKYLKDGDFQQSGSTGGFQAMSEDTASELNGRFSAMQIAMEGIRSLTTDIKTNTDTISDNVSLMRDGLNEIQNIALLQLGQLESINKHTKELTEVRQTLERIDRNTRNL